ncbi:nuclear transport factor 2 family protein [Nocardia bovistercoris]|uniref:Nuclear transport factor 2 family protein n=1 Tax=Nocardia bovistercoris TaxID=2785916 RepID=A0A931N1F2_9NOCA|nr:nuclear transport factor 2 family protein [Nocardia bovistercoris]MBH0775642.1 nuclear transport factor 2 family protein [Nocardia bovistercoris]
MPLEPIADDLLSAVCASPRAVAARDRTAWTELFGPDAAVHDPVGSRPHVGRIAIGRFYDTFIGPNTIVFEVRRDIVADRTVLRDLSVATTMSTGATVRVPMHLRYELAEVGGDWKIARLAAHWELAPMIVQLLRTGWAGIGAATKLGPQLIANQGLGGVLGMTRALFGVGGAGKRAVEALFTAATRGAVADMRVLLDDRAVLELPSGNPVPVAEFAEGVRDMRWEKLIAAGRTVTASVALGRAHGIAVVDFARDRRVIVGVTVYLDTAP